MDWDFGIVVFQLLSHVQLFVTRDYMTNGNSPNGEAMQMPAPASSKQGPGREVQAALLRVKTRPECPEGNMREVTWASKPDCGIATT